MKQSQLSSSDRQVRVRVLPGKTQSCMLMALDACKIRRRCNVLQVPIRPTSGTVVTLKIGRREVLGSNPGHAC